MYKNLRKSLLLLLLLLLSLSSSSSLFWELTGGRMGYEHRTG